MILKRTSFELGLLKASKRILMNQNVAIKGCFDMFWEKNFATDFTFNGSARINSA